MSELNLASRPFVNVKPVRRAGIVLLLAALGLLALNAVLYWRHFTGEGRTRSTSQELTREIDEAEATVERLRRQISALDVEGLNRRTRFVNLEIDRRRFAWSRLFDQVAQVQPGSVRLLSMTPRFEGEARSRSSSRMSPDEVSLELRGVARDGQAILEFLDGLFAHPSFREPDLSRESRREDGMSTFHLTVLYLPKSGEAPASTAAAEDEAKEPADASDDEDTV